MQIIDQRVRQPARHLLRAVQRLLPRDYPPQKLLVVAGQKLGCGHGVRIVPRVHMREQLRLLVRGRATRAPVRRMPGQHHAHRLAGARGQVKGDRQRCAAVLRRRRWQPVSDPAPSLPIRIERAPICRRVPVRHGQHIGHLPGIALASALHQHALQRARQRPPLHPFLRPEAGEVEHQPPALGNAARVAQVDLKHRARRHRDHRVPGDERRPRPHAHLDRRRARELHVQNRIVPPVVDRVGDRRARQADLVIQRCVVGRRKGHRALAWLRRVPLAQRVRNQYPRAFCAVFASAGNPQHRQIQQRPRLHQVVEDRAVAEHPVRFHVDTAGIQPAQRHAARGPRLPAVDNAGDGLRVAGRLKAVPAGMEQVWGKESVTHQALLSVLGGSVSGLVTNQLQTVFAPIPAPCASGATRAD